MTTGGIAPAYMTAAVEWLAQEERGSLALSEASQAEQNAIASRAAVAAERAATAAERAATAAEKANARATIALVIAIVSIAATIIVGAVVHLDAQRQISASAAHEASAASSKH